MKKNIAIFSSGAGTNAENIYRYFKASKTISVVVFCTNKKNSLFKSRAIQLGVPVICFTNNDLINFSDLERKLKAFNVNFIVLAGFLLKIPSKMIDCFPDKIINIHPSLLPKYGGKGMYGNYVHQEVIKNKELKSGISIHLVNEEYDKGKILLQKSCTLTKTDSVESLRIKVQKLEHAWFPLAIENYILK